MNDESKNREMFLERMKTMGGQKQNQQKENQNEKKNLI